MATVSVRSRARAVLVQLPFPSQIDPDPTLVRYYDVHAQLFERLFPHYRTTPGDLWEAPLWVAHLDGAIARDDTTFVDLSRAPYDADACVERIREEAPDRDGAVICFSPLAQNLRLACLVSRCLMRHGYRTAIGGNMTELLPPDSTSLVFSGLLRSGVWEELIASNEAMHQVVPVTGRRPQPAFGYRPRFRLLRSFAARVPMLRINASHGCLFTCSFCGDAWTRQLHVVPRAALQAEFDELLDTFPNATLIYVGDKTFGQSREAVENLLAVASTASRKLQYIVQTHVAVVDEWLLDAMEQLGVRAVEIGFETASSDVLKQVHKGQRGDVLHRALRALTSRGFGVILNVLGGLPVETDKSYGETLNLLRATAPDIFLYNLYNFVPYPKTPLFAELRPRIVDWNHDHWREDRQVVYEPYHLSRDASWQWFLEEVRCCTALCESRVAVPARL